MANYAKEAFIIAKKCPATNKKVVYLDCLECADRNACRHKKENRSKTNELISEPIPVSALAGNSNEKEPNATLQNTVSTGSLLDTIPELTF